MHWVTSNFPEYLKNKNFQNFEKKIKIIILFQKMALLCILLYFCYYEISEISDILSYKKNLNFENWVIFQKKKIQKFCSINGPKNAQMTVENANLGALIVSVRYFWILPNWTEPKVPKFRFGLVIFMKRFKKKSWKSFKIRIGFVLKATA